MKNFKYVHVRDVRVDRKIWGGANKIEGKMKEWTGKCGEGPRK
jgi:hypothetical protein